MTPIPPFTDPVSDPDELLGYVYGVSALDREVYLELLRAEEPARVDDLVDRVDRNRSTVYRSVQRLQQAGLVSKQKEGLRGGGYCHVYRAVDPSRVATAMRRRLDAVYAELDRRRRQFATKYGADSEVVRQGAD